ncbi:MAG: hypothetical protein E7307_06455 [Butyrivibrio sp.]|nr:hypothetical protein [Butyrivibrio sp.]
MAQTTIRGDVEQIAQSAQKLTDFSSDLDETLKSLKDVVDDISQVTYGSASQTLLTTYYALNKDLSSYVTQLATLGSNVKTSSENLDAIDDAATRGLSYT